MGTVERPSFLISLLAGAAAGTTVDVILYPLDTLKTRLQSQQGFWKAGGFSKIYSGLASAALGSAPSSALFFCTYEGMKKLLHSRTHTIPDPAIHCIAAAFGEVAACIVRVPVDIVKQRTQANSKQTSWQTFRTVLYTEGVRGFYRGYCTTVAREIPFAFIQYPLWEVFKHSWSLYRGEYLLPWQAAVCGGFAGGIAAGLTTPLDVAKTRIMLADKSSLLAEGNMFEALMTIWRERGIAGLFSGVMPRVMTMALGGFIFLGAYEEAKYLLNMLCHSSSLGDQGANASSGEV
ncbi:mitochondrial S-adenosylmethionine carrier protein-like [Ornithodoros turicata]